MERYIHTYIHTDKVTWLFFLRMRLLASPFGLAIMYHVGESGVGWDRGWMGQGLDGTEGLSHRSNSWKF
jgi:hypothetical protein